MKNFKKWLEAYSATQVSGPISIPDAPNTRDRGFIKGRASDWCQCSAEERRPDSDQFVGGRRICSRCGKPVREDE